MEPSHYNNSYASYLQCIWYNNVHSTLQKAHTGMKCGEKRRWCIFDVSSKYCHSRTLFKIEHCPTRMLFKSDYCLSGQYS